ncbi:MAG: sigma-70 family RNA polymerase sigma factor [Bacteroidales bacterium]|nr:sigma-70 family RNA polymerase sigma factor [Bacteroidales bacterium]MDE6871636.1 sigma-70 family RNA polymerase sigma factor [Bacteroidales bacterium]MDE7127662.1 sigma-70 family RNA polymerase sigma factor [Bacteroidales bacterium]
MALYRAGEQEKAFSALVQSYKERMYWHIRRFVCSHEDTDDLLQDTFIKIWNAMDGFREDSRLFTWIYRIATNEALNFIRKKKIRGLLTMEPLDNVLYRQIDEDVYFNGNELQRELHKAIQKLPQKQKLVFNLRYFDELSYNEISEILDTSPGSLKASYHHAYIKIKAELEKKF